MGDCKDELKPRNTSAEKSKILGLFKSKKNKDHSEDTLADLFEKSDRKISELIAKKEADLRVEKGHEDKNRISLSILRNMEWHLNQIIELAAEYQRQ